MRLPDEGYRTEKNGMQDDRVTMPGSTAVRVAIGVRGCGQKPIARAREQGQGAAPSTVMSACTLSEPSVPASGKLRSALCPELSTMLPLPAENGDAAM